MTQPTEPASPNRSHRPAAQAAGPAAAQGGSPGAARPGHRAAMTPPPSNPTELIDAATAVAESRAARHQRLWTMTRDQRVAAFWRGDLSFGDCLAWAGRQPDEPPTGPSGEYLFILAREPDWLGEA